MKENPVGFVWHERVKSSFGNEEEWKNPLLGEKCHIPGQFCVFWDSLKFKRKRQRERELFFLSRSFSSSLLLYRKILEECTALFDPSIIWWIVAAAVLVLYSSSAKYMDLRDQGRRPLVHLNVTPCCLWYLVAALLPFQAPLISLLETLIFAL